LIRFGENQNLASLKTLDLLRICITTALIFIVGKKIQVDNLSDDELWQSGYLDCTTARGIFHVVFYYNCVEFEVI